MKNIFIKSIMGGFCISLGGTIYLSAENHVVGAALFTTGLFAIYVFGFYLYTGKLCYVLNNNKAYLGTVGMVFLGNAVGAVGTAGILRHTKLSKLTGYTAELVTGKLSDTIFSTFVMAVFCGFLISVAVLGFENIKDNVGKYIALTAPIVVFVLSGFEHSIADLFYFTMAGAWGVKALIYIIIIALGNLAGGIIIPFVLKITQEKEGNSHR